MDADLAPLFPLPAMHDPLCMQDNFSEADGVEAVHEAFRLGVNFFDTSPLYGKTKSETVNYSSINCTASRLSQHDIRQAI